MGKVVFWFCFVFAALSLAATVYAQDSTQSTTTTNTVPAANVQRTTSTSAGTSGGGLGGVGANTTPIPDPTRLTTEAVDRLKEQMKTEIGLQIQQLHRDLDRLERIQNAMPSDIRLEISNLDKLVNEKFKGLVDQQIQRDNNLALALTAAQKSVTDTNQSNLTAADKAEKNFKDQIEATQAQITDVKDRITRIEASAAGSGSAVNWGIAAIGAIMTIITIGSAMYAMLKPAPVPVPLPVIHYSDPPPNRSRRT